MTYRPSDRLLLFLAALTAALAAILFGTTASASAVDVTGTRVGAISRAVEVPVEPTQGESPGQRLGNSVAEPGMVVATGVAAKTTTSLVGKKYGLGTVVENPGLTIQGFRGAKNPSHGLNQIINRGVSPSTLRDTVANPRVVLEQGSGNLIHIADDAVVVLRPDGQLVTTYGRSDFKQHIFDILGDVG